MVIRYLMPDIFRPHYYLLYLAVIPECLIFNVTWYWMFLINIAGIYILGPIITKFFLVRMASGKGLGMDAFIALIIGIITLILGLIFRS